MEQDKTFKILYLKKVMLILRSKNGRAERGDTRTGPGKWEAAGSVGEAPEKSAN